MMNLITTIVSLAKVIIKSKFFLPSYKTNNKNIIIIGNGPSANSFLGDFKNAPSGCSIMAVNMFGNSTYFKTVKPDYYLMIDHAFFSFNMDSYTNPQSHPKIKNNPSYFNTFSQVVETWKSIFSADWQITFFIPQIYADTYIAKELIKTKHKVQIFNYTVFKGYKSIENWFYRKGLGSPQCQNVVNACIFQCVNSGFSNIYLIGVDNNFHLNIKVANDNQLYVVDDHFYKVEQKITPLISANQKPVRIHELFLSLHKAFYSYQRLEEYARYRGVNIYNSTPDSFIDAFERKEIPSIN